MFKPFIILSLFVLCGFCYTTTHPFSKQAITGFIGLTKGSIISIETNITSVEEEDYDENLIVSIFDYNSYPSEWVYSDYVDPYLCLSPALYREEFHGRINILYTVPKLDRYAVVISNCHPYPLDIYGNITFLSYDGKNYRHIASNQLGMLFVYPIFLISYIVTTIVLGFLTWSPHYRYTSTIHAIDILLFVTVILFGVNCLLQSFYYYDNYISSHFVSSYEYISTFFSSLSRLVFLFILILISTGWQITHERMRSWEFHLSLVFSVILAMLFIQTMMCINNMNGVCNSFNMASQVTTFFLCLYIILMPLYTLSKIVQLLESPVYNDKTILLYINRTMVIHIIKLILTYIFFPLLSSILTAFILSWKYEFINVIIVEIINIYCILKLRIILHPKSYSGFFRINQQIMNNKYKNIELHSTLSNPSISSPASSLYSNTENPSSSLFHRRSSSSYHQSHHVIQSTYYFDD